MSQRQQQRRRKVIDRVIDRANAKAGQLLARLDLSDEERAAATDYAVQLIRDATKAIDGPAALGERVIPASFAFALCWLEEAYQLSKAATTRRPRRERGGRK